MKPRKLKKWDECLEKLPMAWRFYQREIERGVNSRKAELRPVKMVYSGDKNSSTTLRIWAKCGLWPPPPRILNERITGITREEQSSVQSKNGLTIITGGGKNRLKSLKEHSENGHREPELSEREILKSVMKILDKIEVHHKEWTGGRMKKYSTVKTKVFAGRLPVDLLNEIHKFEGSNAFHLERALRLYVKVMRAEE